MNILVWIILGAFAGWIADMIMKGNHGTFEDIILGIVGAFVGGFLMNMIGQEGVNGLNIYSIFVSVIGAIVVIYLGRLLHR